MTDLPYSKRVLDLADKWIKGSITEEEKQEFADWYQRFDDHELILGPEFEPLIEELETGMLASIRQRISDDASPPAIPQERPGQFRITRWQIAVAAVLVLAISVTPFLLGRKTQAPIALQKPAAPPASAHTDVLPGSSKAVLTLDNGSTIVLDSAHNGSLTRQGNTQVVKSGNGALRYETSKDNDPAHGKNTVTYNILTTPRGGQYQLSLPDGSKVWLNAASSIRYPTAFTGTTREVEITGEAYFEIAKNANMPFRVRSVSHLGDGNSMAIEVLGTEFNINAYADETVARTTLVDGKVKVSNGVADVLLLPGQQSELEKGAMKKITDADIEKATAWRNGVFEFGDEELPVIMRQISRWYDVDVIYEGQIPTDRFTGRVTRNTTLSGVLKILKLSDVQFTVTNNKIIVKS